MVLARGADQQAVPGLLTAGDGEVNAVAEVGGVEAEKLVQEEVGVVFKGFEDEEERISGLDSGLHDGPANGGRCDGQRSDRTQVSL